MFKTDIELPIVVPVLENVYDRIDFYYKIIKDLENDISDSYVMRRGLIDDLVTKYKLMGNVNSGEVRDIVRALAFTNTSINNYKINIINNSPLIKAVSNYCYNIDNKLLESVTTHQATPLGVKTIDKIIFVKVTYDDLQGLINQCTSKSDYNNRHIFYMTTLKRVMETNKLKNYDRLLTILNTIYLKNL